MNDAHWRRFCDTWFHDADLGVALDVSRVADLDAGPDRRAALATALAAMADLEAGALANPDEQRQVGHYWLRAPDLAPSAEQGQLVRDTIARVKAFAGGVLDGTVAPPSGGAFRHVLHIGIGGSALGPQLAAAALARAGEGCALHFLDNTDPEGMRRVLGALQGRLGATVTTVVSKSGGTRETRNGMRAAAAAYREAGLNFARHAVAITGPGSALDREAAADGWLLRLPLPDWVGGRTSETSAVGLLPLALGGGDVDRFLEGARVMDELTRRTAAADNPAALLALAWRHLAGGATRRNMVVLPYKDRLALLARYMQQLVMESLGKEKDLDGAVVHEGLTVYGNKGTTDQHAFVQQLRDGRDDFFCTFVQVLEDCRGGPPLSAVEAAAGDDLAGFLLGTREALTERGRSSLLITLDSLDERSLGALIALLERAVGLYAGLIRINAYHQPGVEAGKQAARGAAALQAALLQVMAARAGAWLTVDEIAGDCGPTTDRELAFHLLRHLAANPVHGCRQRPAASPAEWRFALIKEEDR